MKLESNRLSDRYLRKSLLGVFLDLVDDRQWNTYVNQHSYSSTVVMGRDNSSPNCFVFGEEKAARERNEKQRNRRTNLGAFVPNVNSFAIQNFRLAIFVSVYLYNPLSCCLSVCLLHLCCSYVLNLLFLGELF